MCSRWRCGYMDVVGYCMDYSEMVEMTAHMNEHDELWWREFDLGGEA